MKLVSLQASRIFFVKEYNIQMKKVKTKKNNKMKDKTCISPSFKDIFSARPPNLPSTTFITLFSSVDNYVIIINGKV